MTTEDKKVENGDEYGTVSNTEKATPKPEKVEADDKEKKDLFVEFIVEIKKEEIEKTFSEALSKYASDMKLPGFRKGKIPLEVVKSRFKDAIFDEVRGKMVEEAVFKKIEKEKMRIVSHPNVKKIDHDEGENLRADVVVEVFPEVKLPDFETLEVEIPVKDLEVEPFKEEEAIDRLLQDRQRQVPVANREIKDNDVVMVKYQSRLLETKRMTPKKSSYFNVGKEGHSEILDLYQEIIGKKTGDRLTVKRKYPADYKKKIWAGKEVEHYLEIENVFEMVKPDFDENFIKSQGFKDEAEFKKKLEDEYIEYSKKSKEDKKIGLIIDKINEVVDFPLPNSLVEQEMTRMIQQNPYKFSIKDEKDEKKVMDSLRSSAEKSVRFSFIIETVKSEFKLDISTDDLEKEYKDTAEKSKMDIKEIRKYYMKPENKQYLTDKLLRNKVMDLLKEKLKIKEV